MEKKKWPAWTRFFEVQKDDTVKEDYVSIRNDGGYISFFILDQKVVQP